MQQMSVSNGTTIAAQFDEWNFPSLIQNLKLDLQSDKLRLGFVSFAHNSTPSILLKLGGVVNSCFFL